MKCLSRSDVDNRFHEIFEIGCGSYGRVIKAFDRKTRKLVAIKIISNYDTKIPSNEVSCMKMLNGPNFTKLYDDFVCDGALYIIMEYCGAGSVASFKAKMTNDIILSIARDCAISLLTIHKLGMVHGDIKPQNILITSSGSVKLADFGSMRASGDTKSNTTGTELYIAPEIRRGEAAESASDIYSLGMTLFELISGVPLQLTNYDAVDEWLDDNDYSFSNGEKVSKSLAHLVESCLAEEPENRPTAAEIVENLRYAPQTWLIIAPLIEQVMSHIL